MHTQLLFSDGKLIVVDSDLQGQKKKCPLNPQNPILMSTHQRLHQPDVVQHVEEYEQRRPQVSTSEIPPTAFGRVSRGLDIAY